MSPAGGDEERGPRRRRRTALAPFSDLSNYSRRCQRTRDFPGQPVRVARAAKDTSQAFDTKGSRPMPDDAAGGSGPSTDNRHLLLVGAGPGLGMAVARRFAEGGYRVTLVTRSTDGLLALADSLADTGAQIDTAAADASDPEGLRARMTELYNQQGAPGLIIYNAVMGAPDTLMTSSVEHLQTAYAVDVIGAIVVTQVAAPAMRAGGS